MQMTLGRYLVFPLLFLAGLVFSYRLLQIPSRMETTVFTIGAFLIPTLKYPKFGVYYLFCMPFFVPLFRRMYYLISSRPTVDYLMLVSDGVMGGFIIALILLWLINKERSKDAMAILVVCYAALILIKVFVGNQGGTVEGLYGFKFNGLYVLFFFAGSYILTSLDQTRRIVMFASCMLLFTALYGIKQIVFGFAGFEQKWLDSITFTTLRIEGVVRPFSTYASPAAMADGMVVLFALGVYWMVARGRYMLPFGILLCAAAVPPLLIATVRTNWLATMAGLFFFLVFLRIRNRSGKIALLTTMVVGIAIMSAKGGDSASDAQSATMSTQLSRKDKSLSEIMIKNRTQALANPLQEYSVQKRMSTWVGIWYYSLRYPLGRGTGTTGYAHSYYFLTLGETGFPGVLLFLAILVLGFMRGLHVVAASKDKPIQETMRFFLTLIFMFSILNLTGTHLHTNPGDLFFWFSLGCISRHYRQIKAEEQAAFAQGANGQIAGSLLPPEADSTTGGAMPTPGSMPSSGPFRFPSPDGARA